MDGELRGLEQALRADAAPATRLALARAQDRAGRADDAHATLARDPFDPQVTAALTARPCWSRPDADPGRTRWVDLAPLERAPQVRWRTDLGLELVDVAAVTPWGVVVLAFESARYERVLVVLDPRTGAARHVGRETSEVLAVDAGVLLRVVHGDRAARALVALELADLSERWRVDLGTNPSPGHAHGALVLGGAPVTLVPLPDPRVAPALPPAWPEVRVGAITRARLYVHDQRRLRERSTWVVPADEPARATPWPLEPGVLRADDAGVLVTRGEEAALHDPDGAPLWARRVACGHGAVLAPTWVLAWWRRAHVLSRRDGALSTPLLDAAVRAPAGARDWLYACDGSSVIAARVDGAARWSLDLEAGDLVAVAPAWGRALVALAEDGAVVWLEDVSRRDHEA